MVFKMSNAPLRFRADGTFTIVQFTDMHAVGGGNPNDLNIFRLMRRILDEEKPDLVVLTGDLIYSPMCADPAEAYRSVLDVVEEASVPWAAVFGNHDAEQGITKSELMAILQSYPLCRSEPGPRHLYGVGNFMLPVLDAEGRTAYALYFLDSGEYRKVPFRGYDWIRRSQIDWYAEQSGRLRDASGDGKPVPALMFFHIPVHEFIEVWDREVCYGERMERAAVPSVNSGLFAALVEQGDVTGVFVGHDHTNDYWGNLHGIRLCYGRVTGDNEGGKINRGARVIRLSAESREFATWIREDNGVAIREQTAHMPEFVGKGSYYA